MGDQDEPEIIWEDEPAFMLTKQERDDQTTIEQLIDRNSQCIYESSASKKQIRHKRVVTPDHWKQSKPIVLKAIINALSAFKSSKISQWDMQDAILSVILEEKTSKDAFLQLENKVSFDEYYYFLNLSIEKATNVLGKSVKQGLSRSKSINVLGKSKKQGLSRTKSTSADLSQLEKSIQLIKTKEKKWVVPKHWSKYKKVLNGVIDMTLFFYYPRIYKKIDLVKAMKCIFINGRTACEVYTENASKLAHTSLITHVDTAYKMLFEVLGIHESAVLLAQNSSNVTYTELKKELEQTNSAEASTSKAKKLKRMQSVAATKVQNVDKVKGSILKRTLSCLNPALSESSSLDKTATGQNSKAASQSQSSTQAAKQTKNILKDALPVDQITCNDQRKSVKRQRLRTKSIANNDSSSENSLAVCVEGFSKSCKVEQEEPSSRREILPKLIKIKATEAERKLSPATKSHIESKQQIAGNYSSSNALSDCVMIVEETELHVNKSILSFHSDMFKSVFVENKTASEMNVKKAKLSTLVPLLDLFYNRINITDDNVQNLMKMAKLVQASQTLTNCEIFLLQSSTMSLAKKLFLAQEYGLQHLRKQCIDRCAVTDEAKKLMIEPEFKLLKADIFQEIFTKVL